MMETGRMTTTESGSVDLPLLSLGRGTDQFSGLAGSLPFSRPANWSWRDEQQRVFAQHREE